MLDGRVDRIHPRPALELASKDDVRVRIDFVLPGFRNKSDSSTSALPATAAGSFPSRRSRCWSAPRPPRGDRSGTSSRRGRIGRGLRRPSDRRLRASQRRPVVGHCSKSPHDTVRIEQHRDDCRVDGNPRPAEMVRGIGQSAGASRILGFVVVADVDFRQAARLGAAFPKIGEAGKSRDGGPPPVPQAKSVKASSGSSEASVPILMFHSSIPDWACAAPESKRPAVAIVTRRRALPTLPAREPPPPSGPSAIASPPSQRIAHLCPTERPTIFGGNSRGANLRPRDRSHSENT